jgi:SAM-dependent methyltransferase
MTQAPEERFYSTQNALLGIPQLTPASGKAFAPGRRYNIIADSLQKEPLMSKKNIVELGCFKGESLMYAKKVFGFDKAVGIDISFENKYSNSVGDCEFYPANLNMSWPFENGSADVLIAMMLLEHLFDPFESFREIKRVLSPSGRAFVNLPLITSFKNRARLLFGQIPVTSVPYHLWQDEGHWDGFHLHYFTIRSIYDLAEFSGLRVTRIRSVGRFYQIKNMFPGLLCDEISFELRN